MAIASSSLSPELRAFVCAATGAHRVRRVELVQSLWSGYGELLRCALDGGRASSAVVKHVRWPSERLHPRGWSSDRSHRRKVASYHIETTWYHDYATRCADACRVPRCYAAQDRGDEIVLVLEDLDAAGYAGRRRQVSDAELEACLSWLAHFHATFLGAAPDGLWEVGTYWHLATRPDELSAMEDGPLKQRAADLDHKLESTRFRTLVHGDAKLANFCFSARGDAAAAVDFQYVGGGCGMKDLAYFLSSCLDEDECERREAALLDSYFARLERAIAAAGHAVDFTALEADWRALYPVAWTDFLRFLRGWSPDHWKIHRYSRRLAQQVLAELGPAHE